MWASPRFSIASRARAARSSRTSPASRATAFMARRNGKASPSKSSTLAASCPKTKPAFPVKFCARRASPSTMQRTSFWSPTRAPALSRWISNSLSYLRRAGKPPVIVANKVDSPKQLALAAPFYELGEEVFPVSSEHGFGVDDLLDSLTADFPSGAAPAAPARNQYRHHRPAQRRQIHAAESHGRRRALDCFARARHHARRRRYGRRARRQNVPLSRHRRHPPQRQDASRRGKAERGHGAPPSRTRRRGLLVVDGALGVTSHDATIASYTQQSGSALIVVINKWDLALKAARRTRRRGKEIQIRCGAHAILKN